MALRSGRRNFGGVAVLLLLLSASASAVSTPAPDGLATHESPRPLPRVEFEDGTGAPVTLADFRGQLVVLNVWATWCPPCRAEMPTLDRLQGELGGPGFTVVALSVDRAGLAVVEEFFAETGVDHLVPYIDTSMRALPRLGIAGLPTTLVIDEQGRELARRVGEADWASPAMLRYVRALLSERGMDVQ